MWRFWIGQGLGTQSQQVPSFQPSIQLDQKPNQGSREEIRKWKVARSSGTGTEAGHLHMRPGEASSSKNPMGFQGPALGSISRNIWPGRRLWGGKEEGWKGTKETPESFQLSGQTRSSQVVEAWGTQCLQLQPRGQILCWATEHSCDLSCL